MSVEEHEEMARQDPSMAPIGASIITISDSRTPETDLSGDAIAGFIQDAQHVVARRDLVPDDGPAIHQAITTALADQDVQVLLITGGTGLASRDGTVEQLRALDGIEVDGFGELFRSISFQEIGAASLLSRATARILQAKDGRRIPAFAMPGSTNAVTTAMTRLIIPVLAHIVWETKR